MCEHLLGDTQALTVRRSATVIKLTGQRHQICAKSMVKDKKKLQPTIKSTDLLLSHRSKIEKGYRSKTLIVVADLPTSCTYT